MCDLNMRIMAECAVVVWGLKIVLFSLPSNRLHRTNDCGLTNQRTLTVNKRAYFHSSGISKPCENTSKTTHRGICSTVLLRASPHSDPSSPSQIHRCCAILPRTLLESACLSGRCSGSPGLIAPPLRLHLSSSGFSERRSMFRSLWC